MAWYPYGNQKTGTSYATYSDWKNNRNGVPSGSLENFQLNTTQVGPGRQSSTGDFATYLNEFGAAFPQPTQGEYTEQTFTGGPELVSTFPDMKEYPAVEFPSFNNTSNAGSPGAAMYKPPTNQGWAEGSNPAGWTGDKVRGQSVVGPTAKTTQQTKTNSYQAPAPPAPVTVAAPAPYTPIEMKLPEAREAIKYEAPTPLKFATIDEGAVTNEAQRQGAPAVSKLRQALNQVSTIAANEENPAKKREMLRQAMEGAGMSLGDITLASRNTALAKVGKDTDIANAEKAANYQTEVQTGRLNTDAANRAAEIAFNAEMVKSGQDVNAANRAGELAYAAAMTVAQKNADSQNEMNRLGYTAQVSAAEQARSIAAQEGMQDRSIASQEGMQGRSIEAENLRQDKSISAAANLQSQSISAQQAMKREEMQNNAALTKWSTENANLQKKIDREEQRLYAQMSAENQKILAEWQMKMQVSSQNASGQNVWNMNEYNQQMNVWNTIFKQAMSQYSSGSSSGSGSNWKPANTTFGSTGSGTTTGYTGVTGGGGSFSPYPSNYNFGMGSQDAPGKGLAVKELYPGSLSQNIVGKQ
jgi:hypothetical protein